jgi:hypothetical protein
VDRRDRPRLLDAGVPLDARGVDDGTALHYAGMWGRASTVELLLSRGAEVDLMGGPREYPGTALGWTVWGSRELPGADERLDGYLGAAAALLEASARVGEGMLHAAADELSVLLEETASRSGLVRETGLSYAPGNPIRVIVRRRGVNRSGVVSVQAVEGRDIDALVRRTGEASAAVLEALFALDD